MSTLSDINTVPVEPEKLKKENEGPPRPAKLVEFEHYTSFAEFNERFKDGVNPILEWGCYKKSIAGVAGDWVRVMTMHYDETEPFIVELPWCYEAARYICTNQVDILQLPDLCQFPQQ
jgi:hypothetical protein